jgi:hypothetical protein
MEQGSRWDDNSGMASRLQLQGRDLQVMQEHFMPYFPRSTGLCSAHSLPPGAPVASLSAAMPKGRRADRGQRDRADGMDTSLLDLAADRGWGDLELGPLSSR